MPGLGHVRGRSGETGATGQSPQQPWEAEWVPEGPCGRRGPPGECWLGVHGPQVKLQH